MQPGREEQLIPDPMGWNRLVNSWTQLWILNYWIWDQCWLIHVHTSVDRGTYQNWSLIHCG